MSMMKCILFYIKRQRKKNETEYKKFINLVKSFKSQKVDVVRIQKIRISEKTNTVTKIEAFVKRNVGVDQSNLI